MAEAPTSSDSYEPVWAMWFQPETETETETETFDYEQVGCVKSGLCTLLHYPNTSRWCLIFHFHTFLCIKIAFFRGESVMGGVSTLRRRYEPNKQQQQQIYSSRSRIESTFGSTSSRLYNRRLGSQMYFVDEVCMLHNALFHIHGIPYIHDLSPRCYMEM